ncbi:unnamed protein product [Aphis gossypii]|uniref:Uncharacterized protein n=1 Tax=Aphis gossypii TaxID=80765 RepID=A0A9P0NAQ4_APHGO|nr:unnamed protein product [Aphis gossypii]
MIYTFVYKNEMYCSLMMGIKSNVTAESVLYSYLSDYMQYNMSHNRLPINSIFVYNVYILNSSVPLNSETAKPILINYFVFEWIPVWFKMFRFIILDQVLGNVTIDVLNQRFSTILYSRNIYLNFYVPPDIFFLINNVGIRLCDVYRIL